MKKALAFLLLLLTLGTVLTVSCAKTIYALSDDVIYTPVKEKGDKALLEGINIKTSLGLERALLWNNSFSPVTGKNETEVSFVKSGIPYVRPDRYLGLYFDWYDPFSFRYEIEEFNKMLKEAEQMSEAEQREITVSCKMKDYYEYYPLYFTVELPGINFQHTMKNFENSPAMYHHPDFPLDRADGFYEKFCDFFKIPVNENDVISITLENNGSGLSYSSESLGIVNFDVSSAVFEDRLYMGIYNRYSSDEGEEFIDMSLIPGGNGIYVIPFSENDIYYENIKNVYPLPDSCSVKGLYADKENSRLYLMLFENDRYILRVLDERTMTQISQVELFSFCSPDWVTFEFRENFAVFIKNDLEIKTVEIDKNGRLSEVQHYSFTEENEYDRYIYTYNADFLYTSGQLVVCISDEDRYTEKKGYNPWCDFELFVFKGNDIGYYGKYACSLSEYSPSGVSSVENMDEKIKIELCKDAE